MTTNEHTLGRLEQLETFYRRGYRSEVIERSLDKIIALEKAAARREVADLSERLQVFEARYKMPSEEFYRRFRAGELGDAMDFVEWSVFYEMGQAARERFEALEAEPA